jgi:hypothetical protein
MNFPAWSTVGRNGNPVGVDAHPFYMVPQAIPFEIFSRQQQTLSTFHGIRYHAMFIPWVSQPIHQRVCFDRHGHSFCCHYVHRTKKVSTVHSHFIPNLELKLNLFWIRHLKRYREFTEQ